MRKTVALDVGASAVIFTEISPLDEENWWTALPPTAIVPLKDSTVFFEGSVTPPQPAIVRQAMASMVASVTRIPASYRN